jgi:hypothetical protein
MTLDYDKLTYDEALGILTEEHGSQTISAWKEQIISASDVLWYLDEYESVTLEDAIALQGWDKRLGRRIHNGLLNSGADIQEATECYDIADDAERCPGCGTEMYRFELPSVGLHMTETEYVDEYGELSGEDIKFVEQPSGMYWNADKQDDHAPHLCNCCSVDMFRQIDRRTQSTVSIFYGETDEYTKFSIEDNIVMWHMYYDHDMTDLYLLPGDHNDFPKAMARNNLTEFLDEHDWVEVSWSVYKEECEFSRLYNTRRDYRKVAKEWASINESHPDIDFTYIVDTASYGKPSFYMAEENKEDFLHELEQQISK